MWGLILGVAAIDHLIRLEVPGKEAQADSAYVGEAYLLRGYAAVLTWC